MKEGIKGTIVTLPIEQKINAIESIYSVMLLQFTSNREYELIEILFNDEEQLKILSSSYYNKNGIEILNKDAIIKPFVKYIVLDKNDIIFVENNAHGHFGRDTILSAQELSINYKLDKLDSFSKKIFELWNKADNINRKKLSLIYPTFAKAIELLEAT